MSKSIDLSYKRNIINPYLRAKDYIENTEKSNEATEFEAAT